jgi:hypothetical protein
MPTYRRPANVAMVVETHDDGAVVYLAALPSGALLVLEGTSALIWQQALAADGTDLVARLADLVGMEPAAIRDDVETFIAELLNRRLLEAGET